MTGYGAKSLNVDGHVEVAMLKSSSNQERGSGFMTKTLENLDFSRPNSISGLDPLPFLFLLPCL